MTEAYCSLTRRRFLQLGGAGLAGSLAGCAVNPVTGQRQLMLLGESQEVNIDRAQSPHQFSTDFGRYRDTQLNDYVGGVLNGIAPFTHRPHLDYSIRVVNAPHVNAYTFPAGSMGITRGMILAMDDEAELASVLGHELGHVSARHAAARMSKGLFMQLAVAGIAVYLQSDENTADYAPWAALVGGLGAGMWLAHYSRADEREADELGMRYMTRAGHNPRGMVSLMQTLIEQREREPSSLELLFSTHPLGAERHATARSRVSLYSQALERPHNRERYHDATAELRRLEPAITAMRDAARALNSERNTEAEELLREALRTAPEDYCALLLLSSCLRRQGDLRGARSYAAQARDTYPGEAQAYLAGGLIELEDKRFAEARELFRGYQQHLPGNPALLFLEGFACEGMGRRREAADLYVAYLRQVNSGKEADHARRRLAEWGYIETA